MELLNFQLNKGNANPIYSHSLEEFIEAGAVSGIPTYDYWSYIESYNNIEFVVHNVLSDYIPELKRLSTNVYLTDKEMQKYNYKPKLLSADVYGTTHFHYLIMMINGICNVKEFLNINPVKMIPKDDLSSYITSIITAEKKSIDLYNSDKK